MSFGVLLLVLSSSCYVSLAELPAGYPSVPIKGIRDEMAMPLIGCGTWLYNDTEAEQSVIESFKQGYRHVDTAVIYKNHIGVGKGLAATGLKRTEYFVTSKVPGGLSASETVAAADQALADMQLSYVDLMLIHFPTPDSTPEQRKQQWQALEHWAKPGKARAIGVSHYCKTHVEEALSVATVPIAVNQNQYHVGMGSDTQHHLHDKAYTESQGILFEAYSSLCGPCTPPDNMELITGELVTSIGKAHNKSGAQVSLRWVVQQGIPVIPKSLNPSHIAANFDLFDFELTDAQMARLTAATSPPETGTAQNPDDAQDCDFEGLPEGVYADNGVGWLHL